MTSDEAWQTTLRSEHAAVYGYGIVGGRLGPGAEDAADARTALAEHRSRRDFCTEQLVTSGIAPEPAAAAYEPKTPVTTDQEARTFAAAIEQDCAVTYVGLTALNETAVRRVAVVWLERSAIAQTHWSGQLPALPGLAD
jgi:hypothetical protein